MWREQINFIIRYAIFGIVRRVKYVYSRKEELEQLGAEITTREIRQQPELWQETVTLYHENQTALEKLLKEVQAKAQGKRTRVILQEQGLRNMSVIRLYLISEHTVTHKPFHSKVLGQRILWPNQKII